MTRLYEELLPISTIPDSYLPIVSPLGAAGGGSGGPTYSVEAKTLINPGAGELPGAVADAQAANT